MGMVQTLGIDPLKEWEVWSVGEQVAGQLRYGGWFPFVGEWATPENENRSTKLRVKEMQFSFTDSFPNATSPFGPKALAVDFYILVPIAPSCVSDWE